mmetsp:Transcript_37683/g.94756  ORF Transcript_37683/g.94756 Transcript_37683/m.94756 type:complete len:221 (-) Transcript_37683:32-694(-)
MPTAQRPLLLLPLPLPLPLAASPDPPPSSLEDPRDADVACWPSLELVPERARGTNGNGEIRGADPSEEEEDEEEEEEEELEEEADEEEEPPQGEMKLPRIKISYKGTGTTPKRDRRGEPKAESQQTEEMLRKAERTAHRKRQAYKQLVAEKDAIIERLLNLKGKEEDDRPPQVVDVVRRAPPKPPTPPHYRWRYTPTECSLSISSDAPTPDWLTLPARST